ncbi:MAG: hypothetical protein WA152_00915 [Microgenomates group bacterium]
MVDNDIGQVEHRELQIEKFFVLKIGHPDVHAVIEADHSLDEIGIPEIVDRVASETNATSMMVKAKRRVVDVARRKSTEARSAMKYAFEKVHGYSGWTDDKTGKLGNYVYRFCLNGVIDPPSGDYDIAIATNYAPADSKKLAELQQLIAEKVGIKYKVVLAGEKTKLAHECSGYEVIADLRKDEMFGKKLQTFQIGITRKLREKGPDRDLVVEALIHAVREIQK